MAKLVAGRSKVTTVELTETGVATEAGVVTDGGGLDPVELGRDPVELEPLAEELLRDGLATTGLVPVARRAGAVPDGDEVSSTASTTTARTPTAAAPTVTLRRLAAP
jgi:hypothetical protein